MFNTRGSIGHAGRKARRAGVGNDARACRAVLDSVDQPVLALDRNGSVVGANRQALALLAPGSE